MILQEIVAGDASRLAGTKKQSELYNLQQVNKSNQVSISLWR